MAFTNRVRRVFRRKVGKTVNGKNVYQGLRGGLFTHNKNGKNSTVYGHNGLYSTNKNFNPNAYMRRQHEESMGYY